MPNKLLMGWSNSHQQKILSSKSTKKSQIKCPPRVLNQGGGGRSSSSSSRPVLVPRETGFRCRIYSYLEDAEMCRNPLTMVFKNPNSLAEVQNKPDSGKQPRVFKIHCSHLKSWFSYWHGRNFRELYGVT